VLSIRKRRWIVEGQGRALMYRFSASLPIVAIINLPTNMNNQPKELFSYPSIQFVLKFVIYVIINDGIWSYLIWGAREKGGNIGREQVGNDGNQTRSDKESQGKSQSCPLGP
jgi:hypothetical protein